MPLVIFTPRVSVSRICTPSRISFARSVRPDRVHDGLAGRGWRPKPSGLRRTEHPVEGVRATLRCGRGRASTLSQTASPPWTTESKRGTGRARRGAGGLPPAQYRMSAFAWGRMSAASAHHFTRPQVDRVGRRAILQTGLAKLTTVALTSVRTPARIDW